MRNLRGLTPSGAVHLVPLFFCEKQGDSLPARRKTFAGATLPLNFRIKFYYCPIKVFKSNGNPKGLISM